MDENLLDIAERLFRENLSGPKLKSAELVVRTPVHVVYGGANLFKSDTAQKFGRLALRAMDEYAANFVEFTNALWLKGAENLPLYEDLIQKAEFELADNPEKVKRENYHAWFAWTVYNRVIEKLKIEPVEDFRIDFEDGYGIRSDAEEDAHAVSASDELAKAFHEGTITAFGGFRIKSFQPETRRRSVRTLEIFLSNLLNKTFGVVPVNFAVTLPKIAEKAEVEILAEILEIIEQRHKLPDNSIKIEIMIETPQTVRNPVEFVKAGRGRVNSAHFGAFDYTASFGVTADHQHLQHDACKFARQMMQIHLAPSGIRLSDSVTTEMPVAIHRGTPLTARQRDENRRAVHQAWRKHFNNVTNALINGFYQGWDLHPAQLVPRYSALYAFFLESADTQGARLKSFIDRATQAMLTGNLFDDAASAQGLLNFFIRALACGALTEEEVIEKTDLSLAELRSASFAAIMQNRK